MRIEICQVKDNGQGEALEAWDTTQAPRAGEIVFLGNGQYPTQVEQVNWGYVDGKLKCSVIVKPVGA